jgi:molybdenum cofactor cytidylyltransferase
MRKIGAVVLAAGGSSRLGRPKQLLIFRGETLIRRAVRAATEAGCDPIVAVVGENGEAIQRELSATSALIVENREWQRGLGTSIRRGVKEIPGSIDGVVLLACDQPLVDSEVIRQLIVTQETTGKAIVASRYADTLGVPALFDRAVLGALQELPDNSGAKVLIEARPDDVASVAFDGGSIDIDTPEDFARLRAKSD